MVRKMDEFFFHDSSRNGNNYNFDVTTLFERSLIDYPFDDFLRIADKHSEGRIWIIGGFVYRNIIKELYKTPYEKGPIDIDFLVENHARKPIRQRGWKHRITNTGDLSFTKRNKYRIDINSLVNFHSITSRNLPQEIQNFYTGTPLDIQSISYDPVKRIVEGNIGIEAIKNERIEINNILEAQWETNRISEKLKRDFSVNDLVRRKADELGFDYILPPGFDYEFPE